MALKRVQKVFLPCFLLNPRSSGFPERCNCVGISRYWKRPTCQLLRRSLWRKGPVPLAGNHHGTSKLFSQANLTTDLLVKALWAWDPAFFLGIRMTAHILAAFSSWTSTSQLITPSSPPRSTSSPESTTPTSTPTGPSVWTSSKTSGAQLWLFPKVLFDLAGWSQCEFDSE